MKNLVNEFKEESFKNHIGQVVNPGDDVIMIASGYNGRINIRKGKFLGVLYDSRDRVSGVKCEYMRTTTEYDRSLPFEERYKAENVIKKTAPTSTNLWLKRVYKIDTDPTVFKV